MRAQSKDKTRQGSNWADQLSTAASWRPYGALLLAFLLVACANSAAQVEDDATPDKTSQLRYSLSITDEGTDLAGLRAPMRLDR